MNVHVREGKDVMQDRLLLVEDDTHLAAMVSDFLHENGFHVEIENDGKLAAQRIVHDRFDAIVLDIGLPSMNGIDVCRSVRNQFSGPIIVLTARGEEIDEVVALEVGADDFMSKPVRPRALLARLKNHLRKSDAQLTDEDRIIVGDLVVTPARRQVTIAGDPVDMTTAEFDLIEYLALRAGSVVARKDIYVDLLGLPYDGLDRSIDLRVSRVRRKLGDDPNQPTRIKSVRGVGYLMAK
ncbi:MAG TPA: DNA-binding response regulator [Rhodopirellula baltica]|uniref:Two-component response regulator n=4 Tax=Rhodopirellula baltica TaxID=265606 RepID=F2ARE7_RHOBT|nr:two-component response regulator [Rhodopirellula baltica WH47]ELP35835.1 two-component response regulator [Rhodopirellula baltica SWK14]CAD77329.1 probable two-component response regulator [Rhodopirellula baltica SH 1]HBE62785.1 DNA-binding response regulator [Rhodopirellula baltica]